MINYGAILQGIMYFPSESLEIINMTLPTLASGNYTLQIIEFNDWSCISFFHRDIRVVPGYWEIQETLEKR